MKKAFLMTAIIVSVNVLTISSYACIKVQPELKPPLSPDIISTPSSMPEIMTSPLSSLENKPLPTEQKQDGNKLPVTALPAQPASRWSNRAPLLEPNSEFAIAELDGKIYVIGGYPSNRITVTTVQVYDSHNDRWELTTPLPQPINHGMAASVNGKVYIIGGQTTASGNLEEAGYIDVVFEYDPNTAKWTPRTNMPTKRSAGAAVVIGDKIYVAGGRPPRGSDFAVYDTGDNKWTILPDLPTQRNHLAATTINGKVYVAGGRFGGGFNSEVTNILEVYNPATNMWTKKAPMPTPRGGINGIAVNGCFYTWGGEGNNNSPIGLFDQVEVYNTVTDTWIRLDPMPVAVHGVTGAAFINGFIYLPGGGTSQGGSSGSTIHQVLQPDEQCR